jgi:hypothetical protein
MINTIISEVKKKHTGIVLWQGKSLLDGERIAVIAIGLLGAKSTNSKTGDMVQTYIIRRDIAPILCHRLGEDKSICGDCKHREHGTCYVNIGQSPRAVFNGFHDDCYRQWQDGDMSLFQGRYVRFGTYGDPSAVPFEVWETIAKVAKGITGYTHQWANRKTDQRLKQYCMASVDSIKGYNKEYFQAQLMGWRTFRVREDLENPVLENEFICPASKEAGIKTNCENCGACNGTSSNIKKSPVIVFHTGLECCGMRDRYIKLMKKIKNKKKYRRDYVAERKEFKKVCPY